MTSETKIIGFTDSVNECDCCGKTGLKGTFCVSVDGSEFYFGSTCAYKKHGYDKKEVDSEVRKYNNLLDFSNRLAGRLLRKEFGYGNFTEGDFDLRVKEIMAKNKR